MTDRSPRLTGPFWMLALPLAIVGVFAALLAVPATREAAIWTLGENRPVELLSFVLLMVAGGWAVRYAWRRHRAGAPVFEAGFFALFGLGLLVIGAEEVAWGQWFLFFETPESLAAVNTQGELTLHNHEVFNDHLEAFPMLYGLAGLVGIWLGRFRLWAAVAPAAALWVWFALVGGISAVDLMQDFWILHADLDRLLNHLDEAIEMMVPASALLYVAIHALGRPEAPAPSGPRSRPGALRGPVPSERVTGTPRAAVSGRPL